MNSVLFPEPHNLEHQSAVLTRANNRVEQLRQ